MKGITEGNDMQDKIECIGRSLIQHGKFNNRIYLLKLDPDEDHNIILKLGKLANEKGYTKIFCKIRTGNLPSFILHGYNIEAFVPQFYGGTTDCIMVSKFPDESRKKINKTEFENFIELLDSAENVNINNISDPAEFSSCLLAKEDVNAITEVFRRVFKTYPFPVHDPDYILGTMQDGKARYFGIRDGEKLIGISTAEIDIEEKNAEMTDFAVLPEYRGRNLALHLLVYMEQEMRLAGIKTGYTIARLKEPGMNKTFLKAGYKYTGTLVNNTNIGGSIESMNIFYKDL